jgi:hypothetical protein
LSSSARITRRLATAIARADAVTVDTQAPSGPPGRASSADQLPGPAAEVHSSGRGTDHRTGRPSHAIDANPVCQASGGDPGRRRQRTPLNSDMTPEQTLTEMARLVDTGADRLNFLQTTAHRTDQPYPRLSISVASGKRCCFIRISAPMLQFAVEGVRFQP